MKDYFADKKEKITSFLGDFATRHGDDYGKVNVLGKDVLHRLVDFSKQGKMLRGGLVSLACELFNGQAAFDCIALGASLELFQSALLIHDDIMDRDVVRRGNPSVYHQYALQSGEWGLHDPGHTGEALGICAGDIAFFTAFEIISSTSLSDAVKNRLVGLCSRELSYVGVAQMVDVLWGSDGKVPAPEDVLNLYIYKTGRYTFSLPLIIGGIAAGQEQGTVLILENIGTALGVLFQLKDDELGIFGDEKKLGKPIGSDIKEGKKTLFYIYLLRKVNEAEQNRLLRIFGNQHASGEEIEYVRDLMENLGLREQVSNDAARFIEEAKREIGKLNGANKNARRVLEELVEYSTTRLR